MHLPMLRCDAPTHVAVRCTYQYYGALHLPILRCAAPTYIAMRCTYLYRGALHLPILRCDAPNTYRYCGAPNTYRYCGAPTNIAVHLPISRCDAPTHIPVRCTYPYCGGMHLPPTDITVRCTYRYDGAMHLTILRCTYLYCGAMHQSIFRWDAPTMNVCRITKVQRTVILLEYIETDKKAGDSQDINYIIRLALLQTGNRLNYTTSGNENDPNKLIYSKSAHCVGYAAFFTTTCNYLLKKYNLHDGWVAKHQIGQMYVLDINIHRCINHSFFKDHDFAIVENRITGEIVAVDPSVNDYLHIDFVTMVK